MDVVAMGESSLTGWRAKVARAVAKEVSKHTRLSEAQVRAAIGAVFLTLTLVAFIRTLATTLHAGRAAASADG